MLSCPSLLLLEIIERAEHPGRGERQGRNHSYLGEDNEDNSIRVCLPCEEAMGSGIIKAKKKISIDGSYQMIQKRNKQIVSRKMPSCELL